MDLSFRLKQTAIGGLVLGLASVGGVGCNDPARSDGVQSGSGPSASPSSAAVSTPPSATAESGAVIGKPLPSEVTAFYGDKIVDPEKIPDVQMVAVINGESVPVDRVVIQANGQRWMPKIYVRAPEGAAKDKMRTLDFNLKDGEQLTPTLTLALDYPSFGSQVKLPSNDPEYGQAYSGPYAGGIAMSAFSLESEWTEGGERFQVLGKASGKLAAVWPARLQEALDEHQASYVYGKFEDAELITKGQPFWLKSKSKAAPSASASAAPPVAPP